MMNILASARIDESNKFELVAIYLSGTDGSMVLSAQDDFSSRPTSASIETLKKLYLHQQFYSGSLMYGSLRVFQGNDVRSVAQFLESKIDGIKGKENFDWLVFEIVNNFGLDATGVLE